MFIHDIPLHQNVAHQISPERIAEWDKAVLKPDAGVQPKRIFLYLVSTILPFYLPCSTFPIHF
jgi:hypothetical protein